MRIERLTLGGCQDYIVAKLLKTMLDESTPTSATNPNQWMEKTPMSIVVAKVVNRTRDTYRKGFSARMFRFR